MRDLVFATCCERLLPNCVGLNHSLSSRTKVITNRLGLSVFLNSFKLRFPFFVLGLVCRRRHGRGHGGHGPFAFQDGRRAPIAMLTGALVFHLPAKCASLKTFNPRPAGVFSRTSPAGGGGGRFCPPV